MDGVRAFDVPNILVDDIDDSPNAGLDMRRIIMATAAIAKVVVDRIMMIVELFKNYELSSLSLSIVDVLLPIYMHPLSI